MLKNRNYDLLFSEDKSLQIDEIVKRYYLQIRDKQKIRAYISALRLNFIKKVKEFYLFEETIWRIISELTSDIDYKRYQKVIADLQENPLVQSVEQKNKIITIDSDLGKIQFSQIVDTSPDLQVDIDLKNQHKREKKCHYGSILCSMLLRDRGIKNDIVTANRYIKTDKSKYLHSWNEFQMNGREYVLDYTRNLVMNKEGYYALNHISKILSRIDCENAKKDVEIYKQIDIGCKTYVTFRDEIMKDLQKNKDIFEEER